METIENISLRSLVVLQAVADYGGFAEAGRQLSLPRAVISQLIAQLEAQLDAKLFKRTTRKVVLTEEGEALIARLARPLADIRESLRNTRAQRDHLAGTVRLSVSHALGRLAVLPALPRFAAKYPEVQIEILLADRLDDLITQNLDLTIRMGPLPDSSMIARKLGSLDVSLVASPALLKATGTPKTMAQLAEIPAIGFRVAGGNALYNWQLQTNKKDAEQHTVISKSMPVICNSIEGVIDLALMGAGVAAVPRALIDEYIRAGELIHLMDRHRLPSIPIHLYFNSRALMPKRVRVLMDFLVETLPQHLKI